MKRALVIMLSLALVLSLTAPALADDYKIALLTGTVTQNEEELRAAEAEYAKDPDHIILDTYPDSFMAEQEITISKVLAFASDPDVKAIIMAQAVPGCSPAFTKVREMGRDDILLFAITPAETPEVVSAAADMVTNTDEINQADAIITKAVEWGVDVLIHYSFPRHMSYELIVARHDLLQENCDALGIEMYDVVTPDPTNEATGGTPAAQQFVLEDVPAQMEKYAGKKVAFFSTNCSIQPALQAAILEQPDAYYPSPCCPSPYHAFPSTLSLELDKAEGSEYALEKIAEKLAEYDAVGRFSTWEMPLVMMSIEVATEYARQYIEGTITERNDPEVLLSLYAERSPEARVTPYQADNYYLVMLTPVDFNDYLP